MPVSPHAALSAATARLLRPLVRILLRHGISYATFADIAKRVYVDIATEEFTLPGRKQSVSRVSLLTGLTRKEVKRLQELTPASDAETEERHNRAARVIGGWLRDPDYSDDEGAPLAIALEDGEISFAALVRRYSGDVPARAVLDELQRVGAVERTPDGRVRLLARAYIPLASEVDKLYLLGADTAALIRTIDHNLDPGTGMPLFQRKVAYDNLPDEALEAFRALAGQHGEDLLIELNDWLARHDRDTNPQAQGRGRNRAGLGIYYFEATFEDEERE